MTAAFGHPIVSACSSLLRHSNRTLILLWSHRDYPFGMDMNMVREKKIKHLTAQFSFCCACFSRDTWSYQSILSSSSYHFANATTVPVSQARRKYRSMSCHIHFAYRQLNRTFSSIFLCSRKCHGPGTVSIKESLKGHCPRDQSVFIYRPRSFTTFDSRSRVP